MQHAITCCRPIQMTFFITNHYIGYSTVLARLDKLSTRHVKELLMRAIETAHR